MIGTTLGHYRVLERLGAGGMGEVYRAHDEQLDRDVAVKVLPAESLSDPSARARLLREARSGAALNHPHICSIYEVGEANDQAYIAMELVEGRSLDALLAAGALPAEQTLRYGLQIAQALGHAHERGMVHRDLKSANVMITPLGQAKVLDFGLAKRVSEKGLDEATTQSQASLTAAGALVGTLPYMAPEQFRGQAADARSDVWALGVVLYEMAAGSRPFRGQTGFDLSSAILTQPPAPLPGKVPAELKAVIERCLEKEPARRYQRGGEVHAALQAFQTGAVVSWAAWRYRLSRRRWLALVGAGVVLLAVAVGSDVGGLKAWLSGRLRTPSGAIKLAVLPFGNPSGDPEQEYFSDGLTEEMITQLGRLHPQRLGVIARTSAMRYKRTDKTIRQIGGELGVDYVLEGSARREGSRVRVTAELVSVRDQTQVWAESYERELTGVMALQSDLARGVAGSLALKLLPAEEGHLSAARRVDPEAYEAYLKGMHHWYKQTPLEIDAALQYFEMALKKDPNYALAHTGIAWIWVARNQNQLTPPGEALPRAKAAALKALELDGTLAQAHEVLASVRFQEFDWAGAGLESERAIELNPNYPDVRAFYSHYLNIMRRPKEAMRQIERALELDPFNTLFQGLYAVDLVFVGRHDDAIATARNALRAQPDAEVARYALWAAFFCKGMSREALAEDKGRYAADREVQEALERGDREGGYRGAAKRAAEALSARSRQTYVSPTEISRFYMAAGERDHAIEWLEKAFEVREPSLPYLASPEFDSLRSDPRFRDLARRMKLSV
jgi:TolB-like protein/tetratricopeptide (TPR) repeat protein